MSENDFPLSLLHRFFIRITSLRPEPGLFFFIIFLFETDPTWDYGLKMFL